MSSIVMFDNGAWTTAVRRTKDGKHTVRAALNLNQLECKPSDKSCAPTHAAVIVDKRRFPAIELKPAKKANSYVAVIDQDGFALNIYFNGWFGKHGWFFRMNPSVNEVEDFDDDPFADMDMED